jgi:galactosamine-6-phosphate isomerase
MQVKVYPTFSDLSRGATDLIAGYLKQKPRSLVCLASGHTPMGVFECLVSDVKAGRLDITQCLFVGLDEWLGMNGADDGSCRKMMDDALFNPLNIPPRQIEFFDGKSANPQHEVDRINQLIENWGTLDIMLVGVGTNGHVAMNEPGTSFSTKAHISQLAEETIRVGQKYFQRETALSQGLTLGLGHFAESKLPIMMANGIKKAPIMKRVLQDPIGEQTPASVVRGLSRAWVLLDQDAASELK